MSKRSLCTGSFLLLAFLPVFAVALDIKTGDFLTNNLRIDPVTKKLDPIVPLIPTAVTVIDGDYIVLDFGENNSGQYVRKVWRHDPDTGKLTLVAVTDIISTGDVTGGRILSRGPGNEVILYHQVESRLVFVDVVTGQQRFLQNPELGDRFDSVRDVAVASNGNILAATRGSILVMSPLGNTIASVVADIQALTVTTDGRVVGVTVTAGSPTSFVEVNPNTGEPVVLASLQGVFGGSAFEQNEDGDFVLLVGQGIYLIDGSTFEVAEIPWPSPDLEHPVDIDVNKNGDLLLIADDTTTIDYPQGVYRYDPVSGDLDFALLGGYFFDQSQIYPPYQSVLGSAEDLFYARIANVSTEILRTDLRTGGVTVVSSSLSAGPSLGRIGPMAVSGDDIYVIDTGSGALVHVDAITGTKTLLTNLGSGVVILNSDNTDESSRMVFDETTQTLYFTGLSKNIRNAGAVMRVRPVTGAALEVVSEGGNLVKPEGIRIAANGDLIVVDSQGRPGVYRINRNTGAQTVISESLLFLKPRDIEFADNGNILVADSDANAIYRIASGGAVSVFASGGTLAAENRLVAPTMLLKVRGPEPKKFNLSVSKSGSGTVTSMPAGISCGGTCNHSFEEDLQVKLTASPANGFMFSNWNNCPSPSANTCSVLVNANRTIGVVFLADTDKDGMPDTWESAHGLNPRNGNDASADRDGDGLNNLDEYRYGTDPNLKDTDGDGFSDGAEVNMGFDPADPDSRPSAMPWLPLLLEQ